MNSLATLDAAPHRGGILAGAPARALRGAGTVAAVAAGTVAVGAVGAVAAVSVAAPAPGHALGARAAAGAGA